MSRKLLICPWFGDLPVWWPEYSAQIPRLADMGYDILVDHDLDGFNDRVFDYLGIWPPIDYGGTKVHDFRACFGWLYQDRLAGYEWWGHTDFDCVYGRLNLFADDRTLENVEIYSQCLYDYLSGPFTLYRVCNATQRLFMDVDGWENTLRNPMTTGWVETSFTRVAKETVRVRIEDHHACSDPHLLSWNNGRLIHDSKEISFFHFNRTKKWPL